MEAPLEEALSADPEKDEVEYAAADPMVARARKNFIFDV